TQRELNEESKSNRNGARCGVATSCRNTCATGRMPVEVRVSQVPKGEAPGAPIVLWRVARSLTP
ncbi:MAG: hypothetical protein ABSG00_11545, partial [Terracidiphilus sp.]